MHKHVLATILATCLGLGAASAQADPPRPAGGPSKEAVKKAAEERKGEAKEKADDAKKNFRERFGGASDGGNAAMPDAAGPKKDLAEIWAELKTSREDRRKQRLAEIKQKWGDIEDKPAVRAELKIHAWRLARLKRIRAVAEAQGKTDLVARVDKAIAKENERHEKHMQTLKEHGGGE